VAGGRARHLDALAIDDGQVRDGSDALLDVAQHRVLAQAKKRAGARAHLRARARALSAAPGALDARQMRACGSGALGLAAATEALAPGGGAGAAAAEAVRRFATCTPDQGRDTRGACPRSPVPLCAAVQ